MKRDGGVLLFYALLASLAGLWIVQRSMSQSETLALSYSEFTELLRAREVASVQVRDGELRGTLVHAREGKTHFVTGRVDPELATELDRWGVKYAAEPASSWSTIALWLLMPLGVLFAFNLLARRALGGGAGSPGGVLAVGKSKAKVYVETDTKVTFRDVAGVDEAKQELQEIVAFLKNPKEHGRLGARMPKGVLLVGPPGTGKTLLARAVAGEAGVPFFSISGSEFVEMFVGVGAARVRDLFQQARARAPSIIFIDELDALGRARNAMPYLGSHDEKEQTLNQLLSELDGFDPSIGVVLLAATNRPEILDAALLRAGRFDRQVLVDRPDKHGRLEILRVHTRGLSCAPGLALEDVAAMTPGFTGADLANLCNEAALAATRRSADEIALEDFTLAIERIVAGLEKKNRLLNPFERKVVAHHEVGHALLGCLLDSSERVQKISIIPRGVRALGYTLQRPTEDRYLMTRDELERKLVVLMGGRAAEHLVFRHASTGAADDLARATEIARSMATRYGMVPALGHMAYEADSAPLLGPSPSPFGAVRYSDQSAYDIETAIRSILDEAFERACGILERNRKLLQTTAERLVQRETLGELELSELFASAELPAPAPAPAQLGAA